MTIAVSGKGKQMRLIDADRFVKQMNEELLPELIKEYGQEEALKGMHFSFRDCICNIQCQLTVDAVEVVRCNDCKYFEPDLIPIPYFEGDGVCCHEHWKSEEVGFEVKEIDFCSYGERKEE